MRLLDTPAPDMVEVVADPAARTDLEYPGYLDSSHTLGIVQRRASALMPDRWEAHARQIAVRTFLVDVWPQHGRTVHVVVGAGALGDLQGFTDRMGDLVHRVKVEVGCCEHGRLLVNSRCPQHPDFWDELPPYGQQQS